MRPFDLLGYAFSDYTSNKFKIMMSSPGIIIGVASIIAILTLGDGFYGGISSEFGSLSAQLTSPSSRRGQLISFNGETGGNPAAQLSDQDVYAILNASGVISVHPQITVTADIQFNNTNRSVNAMAIIPAYGQRFVPDISTGRFLNDGDSYSVVLSNKTANHTFGKQIYTGDRVKLTDGKTGLSRNYTVVGIMNERNNSALLWDSDSNVYMTKAGFAGVSLVMGGIGIMNVMMLTVRERVEEIGLMKAIGSTTMDVRLIFLTESALLGGISGLIGVIIAWIVAALADHFINMSMPMSLTNILMGVGFGLLITVVFGVYPTNQAAKMDPIEALRTE
jgi:ABC-type antimicrobial peptide transport system permease subunit